MWAAQGGSDQGMVTLWNEIVCTLEAMVPVARRRSRRRSARAGAQTAPKRHHGVTSKASTATYAPPDVVLPVTVITIVWVTAGSSPEAENTASDRRLPVGFGPAV